MSDRDKFAGSVIEQLVLVTLSKPYTLRPNNNSNGETPKDSLGASHVGNRAKGKASSRFWSWS